jgi:hypothetical protein
VAQYKVDRKKYSYQRKQVVFSTCWLTPIFGTESMGGCQNYDMSD